MIINLVIIILNSTMFFVRSKLSLAIIATLTTPVFANENQTQTNNDDPLVSLNTIVVEADKNNEVGKTIYTKEDLEKTPNSSKNITDFLKVDPNVQFGNEHRSSQTQGELAAKDFSINGGLAYDNSFIINGMNFNNNMNPGSDAVSNNNSDLMGSSQAVTINTDLLCDLTVLDSNISAQHGQFMGGVVQATTCAPKSSVGELHGQITYDYTSDEWSRINFANPEEEIDFTSSTSESVQPAFTKQGLSASLYGNLNEQWGFSLSGTERWSKIPLNTIIKDQEKFTQSRNASNLSLETFYTPNENTKLKFGLQHFENKGEYFTSNVKNSNSTHSSNNQNFYINLENQFSLLKLEQQLNYQTQFAERQGANHLNTWRYAEGSKDWADTLTVNEGSFGQFEQEQENLEYSAKASLNLIKSGDLTQQINFGAGYSHHDAYWERAQASYWSTTTSNLKNQSCTDQNGQIYSGCDEALTNNAFQGQFFSGRTVYGAGKIDIQQDRGFAYIEDAIQWKDKLYTTLGLRADYDSLTKETNFAPRTAFTYQPFNSEKLRFTTGWNRYYGLNSFANELQAQKRLLQSAETRLSVDQDWKKTLGSQYSTMSLKSRLETPYSDEIMFAIAGLNKNIDWALKWVNRDNSKQLRQSEWLTVPKDEGTGNYTVYTYENTGKSESDIFTISLKNATPYLLGKSAHQFVFAADYTDTTRNFNDYTARYEDPNTTIYYDGAYTNAGDRPADNFNTPWTARINWNIAFTDLPLNISNFFSYISSKDFMKKTAAINKNSHKDVNGNSYDTYTPSKDKSSFNWDVRTTYALPIAKNYKSIFGLTINNLTNTHNTYIDDQGVVKSEIGRQFIADITFKF